MIITFDDIGGLYPIVRSLKEIIVLALVYLACCVLSSGSPGYGQDLVCGNMSAKVKENYVSASIVTTLLSLLFLRMFLWCGFEESLSERFLVSLASSILDRCFNQWNELSSSNDIVPPRRTEVKYLRFDRVVCLERRVYLAKYAQTSPTPEEAYSQ